jgi:hypothetical protein
MPGRRAEVSPSAKAVAYAAYPRCHLSATPPTPIGAVDGVVDQPGTLSLA